MVKIVTLCDDGMEKYEKEYLSQYSDFEIIHHPTMDEDEIIEVAKDADYIAVAYEPLTERVLSELKNLKMVAYRSIGFNSIDMEYANKINLAVSNIPNYCVPEVADYVMAAILMHNRRLMEFNNSVKLDHKWDFQLVPDMRRMGVLTVGFIGFGAIARAVVDRLKPFGCHMIAYDPFLSEEVFEEYGVTSVSLEDIFKESDYISSHLPLNPHTEKMLDKTYFDLTEKSPVFINSSRGGVVNEEDLVSALNSEKISLAILDVVSEEYPDVENHPLVSHDKVVITPHIAYFSQESETQSVQDNLDNIINFENKNYEQVPIVNRKNIELDY
ncbi:C-terminal binding protein [Dolosicoccus paucivorans]|uniref:C-terminal binding protein n=1 Tax=Dolosicoccus paucivorans TaxID=84521 RepID=UPI000C802791|nr:C-terminal binding protein [Dolosicoccus paucivorans]PMB85089.1 C-terminal binding protein [Dolosicoccus paucivorans]